MNLSIERINEQDLSQLLLEYALKEGWYYSQNDVHFYFDNPYNKIYSIKIDNELAGGVLLHESPSFFQGKSFCSVGVFLVTEKYRGQKIVGPHLWEHAISNNVNQDSIVCFHSVTRAMGFYDKLGFKNTGLVDQFYTLMIQNIHLQDDIPKLQPHHDIKQLFISDFTEIKNYNHKLFSGDIGLGFHEFLDAWLRRPDSIIFGYFVQGNLQGYGVATTCGLLEGKHLCYKFSPIYAECPAIASAVLKKLVRSVQSNGYRIELSSQATFQTEFGATLKEIGFVERGKNFIISNQPELINDQSPLLKKVFCTLPLEYPPEAIATIENIS